MKRIRGFEIAKGFENNGINLPERKTKYSAGYDVESAEDVIIPSFKKGMKPTLVKTGIKAYMQDNEYLMLVNRSSNPGKKGLILANSIGIVDKDYYGNEVMVFIDEYDTPFVEAHTGVAKSRLERMMIRQGMMVKDLGTILVGKMAVEEGIIDEVGGVSEALFWLHQEIERSRKKRQEKK